MTTIKEIRMVIDTEFEYKAAICRIEDVWNAKSNTPDGELFEVLADAIEIYEKKHFPIEPPNSIDVINFRKEQEVQQLYL